jgi:outer membrane receptor protein involved in Fe transport
VTALAVLVVLLCLMGATCGWSAVTGVLAGTVTDAATGAALSGANVSIVGTELATVTDARGRYVITNVLPGTIRLKVSLIGYTDAEVTDVAVTQGQPTSLDVALQPTVVEAVGAEAKVTAPRVSLRPEVTSSVYVVTAADEQLTLSQPNDRYQFPGLVFAQPGVVPDSTFYPHIRGARSNQVGYYLDGIPITEPDANVFATNIVSVGLDRLELYTGGYPAEYGGWTGGIINQVVKRGDQIRGHVVDLGAGTPYNFGGLIVESGDVDGPLDWYYGQYNWHTDLPENLFTSAAPTVSDHIAKVIYDAGQRDSVTLLAAHGYARYLLPFERMFTFDPETLTWVPVQPSDDIARQGHDIAALTLNHTISPQSFWTLRLSRLDHFLQLELGDLDNAFWQHRNERMFTGQFDYEAQLGDHRLRAGVWRIGSDNNSQYSVAFLPVDFISNNNTTNWQAYTQDIWRLNRRLVLNLGARLDRMTYERIGDEDLTLEGTSGRAGATYELSNRVLLRGSYGRYVGFPRANLIAFQFSGLDLGWYSMLAPSFPAKPQLDTGRDLGVEWKPDDRTLVGATWFSRRSRQMTQRWQGVLHDAQGNVVLDEHGNPILSDSLTDFDLNSPVWFAGNGTGTTRGVELKVDRRMNNRLRGWMSYTHMEAKATSPRDNVFPFGFGFLDRTDPASLAQEFSVDWDQRNTAIMALAYRAGKMTINPWMTYGSGFPFGQSGLDVGGSDPAHVPNPNFDSANPASGPEEFVVPQNYIDPNDPSKGFITPNSLQTGKNLTVSLNLAYQVRPGQQVYFQVFNLFDRRDVTSSVIYHPQTGGILGEVEDDELFYVPFSQTPPRFIAFGVRQEF